MRAAGKAENRWPSDSCRTLQGHAPISRREKRPGAGTGRIRLQKAERPREVPHPRLKGAGIVHVKGAFGKFLKHLSPAQTFAQVETLLPSPGK